MSTDAYRKCSKCGSTPIQDGLLSFHRFPKAGKTAVERTRAWAKFCWPEQDWSSASVDSLNLLHKSGKVLCRRHFKDICFTDNTKKRLGKFSVPTEITSAQHHQPIPHLNVQPGPATQHHQPILTPKPKKKKSILKALNVKKLAELTPRETKLHRICTQSLKEIGRLKKQLRCQKKTNKIEKLCDDENVKTLCDMKLSNTFTILLQSQLRNCKKPKKARRYNIDQKIMALTLYKKSPACYRLLRRMFTLPCQSTLEKLLNKIPLSTGVNPKVFEGLKNMADQQLPEENLCLLSFDEMAIRKHLNFNEKLDLVEGFQDHGNHARTNAIASNALVFMVTGVRKKWKQPIAFYFSGKSVTADRLSVVIKEILHECWKTGLTVVGTVCDLSRVNIRALDILGSSKTKPYFTHEGHEVVTILDPPHLLKCTRNLFINHNIEFITPNMQVDGKVVKGVAKWSHIHQFYDLDKTNPNFVFAPALTEQHLAPNSKQKMRVKLAAQVFSHSVTAGILTKIASNELPAEAHATATLLNNFDQLFDALNADSPDLRRGKKYSTNISRRSPHAELFRDMRKFVSEMQFIGSKSPPPSQEGWIRTMNAVDRLWKNVQVFGLKTLSTRRLNQDPLENCFGCIRYHCGSNDNPNVGQFIAAIKTAIINNLRHSSSKKNCEDDTAILNDNLKMFLLSNVNNMSDEICDDEANIDLEPLIADATEALELASPEAQACAYVCGFMFKKLKTSGCTSCKNTFLSCNATSSYDNINLFVSFKEYDTMHNSLKYVSKTFVHCVEICSSLVNSTLNLEVWRKGIKKTCMSALSHVDMGFLKNCQQHFLQNKHHIMVSTFYICVKRYITLKNRGFGDEERSKALQRKMRILRNN